MHLFLPRASFHYCDIIMGMMMSQITSLMIVCSTIHWGADQRKHQSSASLAFVRGIHRWPVNSPHIWPVRQKMFPFDDVIIVLTFGYCCYLCLCVCVCPYVFVCVCQPIAFLHSISSPVQVRTTQLGQKMSNILGNWTWLALTDNLFIFVV